MSKLCSIFCCSRVIQGGQGRCAMSLPGVRGGSTTTRESLQKSEISTDSVQAAPWLGCTPPSSIAALAQVDTRLVTQVVFSMENGNCLGKNSLKRYQSSPQVEISTQMLNNAQSTLHAEHRGAPSSHRQVVWGIRNGLAMAKPV